MHHALQKESLLDDLAVSLKDKFKLTDEGDLSMFLYANPSKHNRSTFELAQSHPIERMIETLGLNDDSKTHDTPANAVLHKETDGKSRVQSCNCRSAVDILSCLASTSCPGVDHAAHQCDRF